MLGVLGVMGLAGCAPQAPGSGDAKAAGSTEAKAASNGVVATDNGSSAITVDWLGSAPEIAESDIAETKDTDLLIVAPATAA